MKKLWLCSSSWTHLSNFTWFTMKILNSQAWIELFSKRIVFSSSLDTLFNWDNMQTLLWVLWPFFCPFLTLNNSSGHSTFLVKFVALLSLEYLITVLYGMIQATGIPYLLCTNLISTIPSLVIKMCKLCFLLCKYLDLLPFYGQISQKWLFLNKSWLNS